MPDLDRILLDQCYCIAKESDDKDTHIGAVIVDSNNEIKAVGCNRFPVGGLKDGHPERLERPEKYYWIEHAERDAICDAARRGTSLLGCRIYVNGTPCMDCGRAIILAGIKEVIVDEFWDRQFLEAGGDKWLADITRARQLLSEAGVAFRAIKDFQTDLPRFVRGRCI